MGMFSGKKGIIMGIANERSLATAIARFLHKEGAKLGFSHLPDRDGRDFFSKRIREITGPMGTKTVLPCDVSNDEEIKEFFSEVGGEMGTIDFLVHSIAFAPQNDIRCPTVEVSRKGFLEAMSISAYSFISVAREAAKLMPSGGSIATMTYFGAEKVVGGYNLMGVCKAALEAAVRYLAFDLAPLEIRVNAVSAGHVKTLSSSIFSSMTKLFAAMAPTGKNITAEQVAKTTAYLLSDLSLGTTGEILHVDGGYNIMGSPGYAFERLDTLRNAIDGQKRGAS